MIDDEEFPPRPTPEIVATQGAMLGYRRIETRGVKRVGRLFRFGNANDINVGDELLGGVVFFLDRDEGFVALGYERAKEEA